MSRTHTRNCTQWPGFWLGFLTMLASTAVGAGCRKKRDNADAASANLQGMTVRGGTSTMDDPAQPASTEDGGERHVAFSPTVVERAARANVGERAVRAGETLTIPAGRYHVGSTPGDEGRDPALEADGISTEVPVIDIDALPYPNDPQAQARTGVSRDEAIGLCAARSRRLCTEVEWERACRGSEEHIFPNGDRWDPAKCVQNSNPGVCASSFGAMRMGTHFAEWTTDNIAERAVIRGAGASAPEAQHRCAARRTAIAGQSGLEVGFRCCGGSAPSLPYPREISRPPFRAEPMTTAQVSEIMATIPELSRVRAGFTMLGPAAINEVLNHGATTAELHPEATFSVQPVRWSPTFGEEILVFVGTSTVGSFVAALWVLPSETGQPERYKHAASYILAGDRVAMTLAHTRGTREEIQWSACWNCGGEHGLVTYDRVRAHVIAVQR